MNKENSLLLIQEQGILPLFYHDDSEVCCCVLDALYGAGIRTVEFTNRGANALNNFILLQSLKSARWQGLQLGVGTVLNADETKIFAEAGADFIISPGTVPAIARVAEEAGLLWIPGCLTPTEIILAKDNGATLIKIFPGSLLGPSYISAVKEIFPAMLFMPTGGVEVSESNISAWFRAGVCAVGLGSKVISKEALANKEYKEIEQRVAEAVQIVKKIRFAQSDN